MKQEETYNINDELIDQKEEIPVKSNKIKYAVAITISVVLISAVSVLFIGHYYLNWFQAETYKISANINRVNHQASYFTETKTILTEYSLTNGDFEKKTALVTTNFVVILTDRKKLEKENFLNTASLIILDSSVKAEEVDKELTSFKIFDEETIKELEANPDGSKYPMAVFTFFEDGTIEDIKVPDNMDKYHADSIVELIQNVIPKLTRNRKEDLTNGLNIKERKNNRGKTIVEYQAPRTFEAFKGSKYSKLVERDIENEQISNIRVRSSSYFQTEDEDLNDADFGIKDFLYNTISEIKTLKTSEEKETAQIVERIAKNFNFISSQKLIENILEKERIEQEIPLTIEDIEDEEINSLRKLGFNFNVDKTFNIKSITFLGQTFSIKYRIAVKSGKAINQIIISSNLGTATFGNGGIDYEFSKSFSKRVQVFKFVFPPFPAITLGVYAGGSLSISVKYTSSSKTGLKLSLSGSLTASAEIKAGSDKVLSFSAGATGDIVKATGYATVTGSSVSKGYSVSGGKIVCYVVAKALGKKVWKKEHTLFNGWSS